MVENCNFIPSRPEEFFTEYLDEEMEFENAVRNDHSDILSENISSRQDLFGVKFTPSLRQFKGQTSAPKNAEFAIQPLRTL